MNELDFNLRFLDLLNKGENIPAWGIPSVPQPIIVDENKYKLINCGVEYAPQRLYGVYWRQSNISYYRIAKGADAISFQFTGCYLAKVMYNSDYFVFHIHHKHVNFIFIAPILIVLLIIGINLLMIIEIE